MDIESPQELHTPVVEVEFSIWNAEYPFIAASASESCTFELAKMMPRSRSRYVQLFNVFGANPARIIALADSHETVNASLLAEYDCGGLFEFDICEDCPTVLLAELGALLREVYCANGFGHIVAELPTQCDASAVIKTFLTEVSDTELVYKREKQTIDPFFTPSLFQHVLRAELTDRQRELLEAAFDAGYYDWPRKCTGTEIAETFGISSATFSEHIRAAERNLFTALFDSRS